MTAGLENLTREAIEAIARSHENRSRLREVEGQVERVGTELAVLSAKVEAIDCNVKKIAKKISNGNGGSSKLRDVTMTGAGALGGGGGLYLVLLAIEKFLGG